MADDSTLFKAVNNWSTTLTNAITDTDTTITLDSVVGLPTTGGVLTFTDTKEIVHYTSISGNDLIVERGYDGTTAASHSAGQKVEMRWIAAHHNVLKDEIISHEGASNPHPQSKLLQTEDIFADFVVSGLLPATSTTLTSDISAGAAYVTGVRVVKAVTSHTYTASKDTYVDLDSTGVYTFVEVANGAAEPALTADSIRLAKVVTDASTITTVTDMRNNNLGIINRNVGIGTTNPTSKLDVDGTIHAVGRANPTAGKGLELFYDTSQDFSGLISYDRSGSTYKPLTFNAADHRFYISGTEKIRIDTSGNVGIGGTGQRATTAGAAVLNIFDGTAPAGTLTNGCSIYSSAGELYEMDAAGNATLQTPHKFELFKPDPSYEMPFSYYSENRFVGKKINVDMFGAIREIEKLSGKKFIYIQDLLPEEKLDWDKNEEIHRMRREKEIKEWKKKKAKVDKIKDPKEKEEQLKQLGECPKPYVKRQPPAWIAERIKKKWIK